MPGADAVEIPGYDELVEIGRGGFAVVYRARQVRLHRPVAVKVLTGTATGPAALERFARECAAIGALSGHPNVVAVHDAGTTADGRPYLAMELVGGGTLADRLEAGPLPVDEVLAIGAQLADALATAHAADVLHRDVKPENVLLAVDGTPKLADFGIAMVADAQHTATGVVLGTVLHAAPEVLTGSRATPASDVYSLASTMDALLRGRAAFAGETGEGPIPVMYRSVHEPAPDLRAVGVPAAVATLVEAAMAKDPAARIPDAATFRRRIEAVRDQRARGAAESAGAATAVVGAAATSPVVVPPPPVPPGPAPVAPAAAGPGARDRNRDDPADRGRAGLVLGLVAAVVVLAAVVAVAIVLLGDDGDGDDAGPTTTVAPTESSTDSSTTASSSTSTSTSTSTTASTTTSTTEATTTTSTAPVAADEADAAALIADRYPDWTVVDSTGFRATGAGAVVGEDADGQQAVFLFGGGRLIGRDTSEPSARATVVDVSGNDVRIGYDTWAADTDPPDPPAGYAEVVLRWPGTDEFVLEEGTFPPTDPAVEGHR